MIWPFLALLLACGDAPSPLPPVRQQEPAPKGRMVSAPDLTGYIVRPNADGPHRGVLVLVDTLDDEVRRAAIDRAAQGEIVLVVDSTVEARRASRYLEGVNGVATVATDCQRADCQP